MSTLAFDSLRYARKLRDAGVPEPQADVQAELMAEAFGFYAENILTRDHFTEVLNSRFGEFGAQMDARFTELEARFDKRFTELDAKFDKRFTELDAKFDKRFTEQDARFDKRFAEQDAKFDKRFAEQDVRFNKIELGIDNLEERMDRVGGCVEQLTALTVKVERTQFVHTWTLGVGVAALLVPQLNSMFGWLRAI